MGTTYFQDNIKEMNFSFLTEKEKGGVLLTENYENIDPQLITANILFALETAKKKYNADAVYFRFFSDGRAHVPHIYIYDYTYRNCTTNDRERIHIQMWNGEQVPIYVIVEKSCVSVFDSRKRPTDNGYIEELFKCTGEAIKEFEAKSFENGLFWEEEVSTNDFQFENSATKDLIRGLKEVYRSFQEESGLDSHVALKLLVQSLLIKYLEERDEESQSGYFAETYFRRNFQCENFCDTIRKGKLLLLLDTLSRDFNGKIFEWDVIEEADARNALQKIEIKQLADYLDGNIQNSQYILWRMYSFSHLPVEVISSVYEELLTNSKDIVYTPEMIVGTLVDECMPLKQPNMEFKLIDVSCGSGIFLVKAYKRMVQWWRYEQWKKTGKLVKPPLTVLRKILTESIFGIDIEQDAVRLSVFSLALAMLDEVNLDPPTWGKLRFPDLSKNIIVKSFFEYIISPIEANFNLVVGNPPFNLQMVNGKEPDRKGYFNNLKKEIGYQCDIKIPDENPALHFLVQSMKLLKPHGLLCLIQPSAPILYQENSNFKRYLFSKYNLLQVIDFTKLADILWGRKKVATAAIFLENSLPDNERVLHLIVNRTFSNINRLFLEFDYYDFHFIDKEDIIDSPYIWKANLLGGGRIIQLIRKLASFPSLKDFLKEKVENKGWKYSEGYTIGNRKHYAEHLFNRQRVTPKNFTENGVLKFDIETENFFEAPRTDSKEIFLAPHILIKENIGKHYLPIQLLNEDAVFSHEIVGIYAPEQDYNDLVNLFNYIVGNNLLYRFYILVTSSRLSVGRKTAILKKDIDNLPLPYDVNLLTISPMEKIVIEDVLFNIHVDNMDNDVACTNDLIKFSEIFNKTLNSIYKTDSKYFELFKIIETPKYYALHFVYSSTEQGLETEFVDDIETYIDNVIGIDKNKLNKNHIQKILKIYGRDSIIIVKPKRRSYWLLSLALRDADDSFADYIKARY